MAINIASVTNLSLNNSNSNVIKTYNILRFWWYKTFQIIHVVGFG